MSKIKRTIEDILVVAVVGLALILIAASAGGKKDPLPEFFPVERVQAGLKGYGLTVFKGSEPERFDVEVISVLHQFLPKQDLILVRCSHPVLDHAGIIAGMSGSPVFFEGKLAGAVAYTWRFAKDPIAGVTPAAPMLEYFKLHEIPRKGGAGKFISSKLFPPPGSLSVVNDQGHEEGGDGYPDFWKRFSPGAHGEMVPLTTPLAGGMLQGRAAAMVERELGGFFMAPVSSPPFQAKAGDWKKGRGMGGGGEVKILRPGDPVAIQLVRGDIDMSGSGTITAARGKKLLAFGHPMFNYGRLDVPAAAAYVHHCLASLNFSFKMTEPLEEVGSLVVDRQAGILIDGERKPHVVPLKIAIDDRSRGIKENWSMELLHHRMLTPSITRTAITAAVDKSAPDLDDAIIEATYSIDIHGHKRLLLEEKVFQPRGTLSLDYSRRLSEGLESLISSDFEEVMIDGIEARISIDYAHAVAEISGAYLSAEKAEEGDTIDLFMIAKPHRGSEMIYSTSIRVPAGTEGKTLEIEVEAGGEAAPETVAPYDLEDVIENLSKAYPSDSVVVTVQLPGQGVSVAGKIMRNLPPSALDTLRPKAAYLGEQPEAVIERKLIYPGMLMGGKVRLNLQVKGKEGK